MKKKEFLSNQENNQMFLVLLGDTLCVSGCKVQHATSDADLLIVQTAVTLAGECETALVGDNTDLLVLLLYHAGGNKHDIYFRPEPKGGTTLNALV